MKDDENSQFQQQGCIFCPKNQDNQSANLFQMMNQALISKHSNQLNTHLVIPIDIILKCDQPNSTSQLQDYIIYKQMTYVDQIRQILRRQYKLTQWPQKIQKMSQYYKFHKDSPHIVQQHIQRILAKYYDRRRQYDYKCIKKLLKQQQGVSITSIQDTVTQNTDMSQQKSKYSTLLDALKQTQQNKIDPQLSDSNLLSQICKQIDQALPQTKLTDKDFPIIFYQNTKHFENYIKSTELKKKKPTKDVNMIEQTIKKKYKNIESNHQKQPFMINYLNLQKKKKLPLDHFQSNQKIQNKNKNKKIFKSKFDSHHFPLHQDKKKFVYNTNIKIQIQNAMFYPNQHHQNNFSNLCIKDNNNCILSQKNKKYRKSLINKINQLNQDRQKTPLTKIYQTQDQWISNRCSKFNTNFKKQKFKSKLTNKNSKQFKTIHQQKYLPKSKQKQKSKQKFKQITLQPKRIMSQNNLRKTSIQKQQQQHHHFKHSNHGTISLSKLKNQHQNQRNDPQNKLSQLKHGVSLQNIRRRSVTLTKNKELSQQKIPFSKYSSSQIRNPKFKSISINNLISKKLSINQK